MKARVITTASWAPGRWLQGLHHFLFEAMQVSGRPFIFFRVSTGILLFLQYLAMFPDLEYLFGNKNVLPADVSGLFIDNLTLNNHALRQWLGLGAFPFSVLFTVVYLSVALLLVLGFKSRWTAFLLLLLHVSLFNSNVFFMYGADYFMRMSLFYLVLFPPAGPALFARGETQAPPGNFLVYRRFLQLHLVMVYVFSGIDKLIGYNWRNGEAVWKAVNLPHINTDFHIDFSWLAGYPLLAALMGWGVLLTEIGYPLIMWKRWRPVLLGAAILLHLGIALVMNLYFFSAVMITWNLAAFYDFDAPGKPHKKLAYTTRLSNMLAGRLPGMPGKDQPDRTKANSIG